MSEQNSRNGQLVPIDLDAITFDTFDRTVSDIICVAPVRTVVRREEEILIIRRVRKIEEIDAGLACARSQVQMSPVQQEGGKVAWQNVEDEQPVSRY